MAIRVLSRLQEQRDRASPRLVLLMQRGLDEHEPAAFADHRRGQVAGAHARCAEEVDCEPSGTQIGAVGGDDGMLGRAGECAARCHAVHLVVLPQTAGHVLRDEHVAVGAKEREIGHGGAYGRTPCCARTGIGIDGCAAAGMNLKVEVGAGDVAGGAGEADDLARVDLLAGGYGDAALVADQTSVPSSRVMIVRLP